jgi:hypothetical protein
MLAVGNAAAKTRRQWRRWPDRELADRFLAFPSSHLA